MSLTYTSKIIRVPFSEENVIRYGSLRYFDELNRLQATVSHSQMHPGFYDYRVARLDEGVEDFDTRPSRFLGLDTYLKTIGVDCYSRDWVAYEYSPADDGNPAIGSVVYFIRSGTSGPIKIGFTDCLGQRLIILQSGNPERLSILATIKGGKSLERGLHRRFQHLRLRGEWFAPVDEIISFIATEGTPWKP